MNQHASGPGLQIDLAFRAFSDRTRLRILNLLQVGELRVTDIVRILDLPQPRASRHLGYLRRSQLVRIRKTGPCVHYSLAPPRDLFHQRLLECLGNCLTEVAEMQADLARAAAAISHRTAAGADPRNELSARR